MSNKEQYKSKIGGQAVIEGMMMCGVHKTALAVRATDGEIKVETWENNTKSKFAKLKKLVFIRGLFNMIDSMLKGYKCLTRSMELSGLDLEEESESKFDKWLEEKLGDNITKVVTWIGAILGVVLSVVLFMFIPSVIVWGLSQIADIGMFKSLIEGIIKIVIFIVYLILVGKVKEMRRIFEYHGAEHKTIACLEAGEELTVENIKKQVRFHPRCGTSFLILVLIISILVFSVISITNPFIRTGLKLLMLPIVVGISYELIKLAGKYDNWFTKIISFPGLQLQRITTNEPDDSQIEVAIRAITPVIPEDLEEDKW